MKKVFSINKKIAGILLGASVVAMSIFSCNKDFENTLRNDYGSDSSLTKGVRKTLLIVVDGALGVEVRKVAPPNLSILADFSIHSYDALADYNTNTLTNPIGWSTILTGVGSDKHQVTGTDFTGNNLDQYPSLFTRLKIQKPDWRTSAFGASPEMIDSLAADATEKTAFAGDDAAVKEAVLNELASKSPALVLAQFHDVDKAGMDGSYSATDAGYKAAILKTDEYIGEILEALRSRPSFANENWMVMVTSTKGNNIPNNPAAAARNAYSDSRRNTFFFCFNPRFNSINPTKPGTIIPYIGNAPLYDGNNEASRAQVLDAAGAYDFGEEGSFTIQCKVKIKPGGYYYPAFIGKRESFASGSPGWVFFLEGDVWQVNFGQVGQGNTQVKGSAIADDKWHTLTVVIKQEGATRMAYTYTDGVASGNSANIAAKGNLNSTAPLTVGYIPGSRYSGGYSPTGYFVTDVRIYDTALEASYIASNYCQVGIEATDPYAGNVLGFWPCTSVSGTKEMPDFSGNGHPMTVDLLNATTFNELSTQICPQISEKIYRTVPNSVDVASQIYRWYGILVPASWQLDGKIWIPTYSDVNSD